MQADNGPDVFFHIDSYYGNNRIKTGDRVCFSRHAGGGSDRAFPVIDTLI
ncbi:hypothetical protein [Methylobacterium frigidaeris]